MQGPRILLASASPRRRALVELLGLPWRAAAVDLDEEAYLLAEPTLAAANVALAKARAAVVAADEVVLAADTVVALDGAILGKPADERAAWRMLTALRGRPHVVATGVALRGADGVEWLATVSSQVVMRAYADDEIAAYVARGEPFDKAGGYATQDARSAPVAETRGCELNVVGLPLCAVARGLETLGVRPGDTGTPGDMAPPCTFCRRGAERVRIA